MWVSDLSEKNVSCSDSKLNFSKICKCGKVLKLTITAPILFGHLSNDNILITKILKKNSNDIDLFIDFINLHWKHFKSVNKCDSPCGSTINS